MAFGFVKRIFPTWQNALLAVAAAVLLILAFPDFEYWFLAWFALVPLMIAVEREKASVVRSFVTGWLFGTTFFFSTCWWLTYAPIHYASFPPWLAYSGMVFVALIVGVFPGLFASLLSALLRRFGSRAFLAAPFVWVLSEFLRYWLTGNNWNAIGYSQAFTVNPLSPVNLIGIIVVALASIGGIGLVAFFLATTNAALVYAMVAKRWTRFMPLALFVCIFAVGALAKLTFFPIYADTRSRGTGRVVAIQPDVPMSGVDYRQLEQLRKRQFDLAETELEKLRTTNNELPTTVILPESPMNFMYNDDREFQHFVRDFTTRNNASLIFNSAEPDATNGKYFNSAMMIGADGKPVAQYDKIYLLPFGEAVPVPLESIVPAFVGSFSYGREYDLLPVAEAKAGIMICFESHFGALSREYVRNGADVIIEMTNDGYLGPTPVLRQHLANAVFRAVETNRPVLRVTNVGVTAYITENGQVLDPAPTYEEATRVWNISKSDGSQTFYVRYGDWFEWMCTVITLGLAIVSIRKRRKPEL